PVAKTAQLPADSLHLVLTVPRSAEAEAPEDDEMEGRGDGVLRGQVGVMKRGQKPSAPAPAKAKATTGKPFVLHGFAVPDAGHTWLVYAADEALAVAKARAVLPGAPDSGTLAKRADMDSVRDQRSSSGGFFSARGLAAASPFVVAMG